MRFKDLVRTVILGFVGFCSPRLAVALGVPLDAWIADLAGWLTATKDIITRDQATWGAMWVSALALALAELWWHPLRNWAARSPNGSAGDAELLRAQAELEKQRRLTRKQMLRTQDSFPSTAVLIHETKNVLRIEFGEGGAFETIPKHSLYGLTRQFHELCVEVGDGMKG